MHRAILSLGFVQALGYVFPFVTLWIVSRGLSDGDLSAFLYAQSLSALLAIPVEYGFHLSAVRLATNALKAGRMCEATSEILFARLLLFAIATTLVFPIVSTNAILPLTVPNVLGVLLAIAAYGFKPLWYFQATDRYGRLVRTEFVANVCSFLAVAIAAFLPGANGYIILAWALPRALGVAWLVSLIHAESGVMLPAIARISATLREAFPLFMHKIAAGAVHMATPVLLAYLISAGDLGAYQKGERIVTAVQSLLLVISQVGYAHVMRAAGDSGKAGSKALEVSVLQTTCALGASLVLYLSAPLLLQLFWGEVDGDALKVLQTMCLLLPILGVNAALALNYLLPAGRDSVVVGAAIVGAVVSLSLLVILAPYAGPLTGVGGVLTGELAMTIFMGLALFLKRGRSGQVALTSSAAGEKT